ncbi:MAG: cupin domain-containing protein [Geminicoccaceae bacterium]|nr:cupin domain-containing protein [Geminicoccaceae bacterium]
MRIHRSFDRPSVKASADWFTGTVWQDPIVDAPDPARIRAVRVAFEPGARTNWHTHPLGQTLHVLAGVGLVQKEGEPVRRILPGDTVWIGPDEKHWHGASANRSMMHLALHEHDETGTHVTWLEPVSDADYGRPPEP